MNTSRKKKSSKQELFLAGPTLDLADKNFKTVL